MSLRVCHIVPQLPPVREGVGLYAMNLAEELRRNERIESVFLVAAPGWRAGEGTPPGTVALGSEDGARTAEGLREAIDRCGPVDRVLLHYVGYGYDREGLPFWLARAVGALREAEIPFVIVYHEMWATGPFWKKAFYTAPFQKRIARDLLRTATAAYTTVGCYDRLLRGLQTRGVAKVSGPISGFGLRPAAGMTRPAREEDEPLRLLLYGLPFTRLLALRAHRGLLRRWNAAGKIGKVIVMGRAAVAADGEAEAAALRQCGIDAARVERRHDLPEAEIAPVLAGADLYLTGYRACLIGKSTTVLSAMAAGCPVLAADAEDAAPLLAGFHFFSPDEFDAAPPTRRRLAEVGAAGRRWWEGEGAPERIASKVAALLRRGGL
ncbi:Glycosyltransferase involved in cell wall bisynthesis [Verrucomicrobium sp. GAS474]|uniref:hypothetical protein n=1 Tax=Verrucomicrobium sp. GAS474 TaxID=1882831 RepID=UPI000879E2B9|nr:hypothetical protein [Verrucomicrobium sp. GAS474]SDT86135.1 Glycosyltransferase involved in cell wall bisynthesis [Verrucomicrobium sp. GAS474]